jgi:uncharacterized protein with von Willebrand factor type A (vWA) domain
MQNSTCIICILGDMLSLRVYFNKITKQFLKLYCNFRAGEYVYYHNCNYELNEGMVIIVFPKGEK